MNQFPRKSAFSLVSVLLVAILALSMSLPALAADTVWATNAQMEKAAKEAAAEGRYAAIFKTSAVLGIPKNIMTGAVNDEVWVDSVADDKVQVRVCVTDPAAVTSDLLLSGHTSGKDLEKTAVIFRKWFSNKFQVVSLDQKGAYGQVVDVAVNVNLSKMNKKNLYFYVYNKDTNTYVTLTKGDYSFDDVGYLWFSTAIGGEVIISDGQLAN